MKSDEKLYEIVKNIYRELYQNSSPKGDWDKLIKSNSIDFFEKYFISREKYDDILDKHLKKHKLTKMQKNKIKNVVALGSAPMFLK